MEQKLPRQIRPQVQHPVLQEEVPAVRRFRHRVCPKIEALRVMTN